jgi:acyl-CoA thioester hydrolase
MSRADLLPSQFDWRARVYWEDTDGGGVVYHSNYLRYFERARTEWLRSKGYEQRQLQLSLRLVFAVYAMQLEFLKPARLDDEVLMELRCEELRRASFAVSQRMLDVRSGAEICRARVEIACLDVDAFRPIPIPQDLWQDLKS